MKNKTYRFAIDHIKKNPLDFGGVITTGLLNSCVSFLLPVTIGEFFTVHFHTHGSKSKLLSMLGIHINTIHSFYMLFFTLLVLKILLSYMESFISYRTSELFVKNLRENLFITQINWHPSKLSQKTYGKYLLRYSNDLNAVQNYFRRGVLEGIKNLLFFCTGLFMLSQINIQITVILMAVLLLSALIMYVMAGFQRTFISTARSYRSSLLAFVAKSFGGFERLRNRQLEDITIKNFKKRSETLYHANMRSKQMDSILQSSTHFYIFIMIATLLWRIGLSDSKITASEGLMMILMIMMMQGAIRKILKVPVYLNKGRISLQKIDKVITQSAEEPDAAVVALNQ